MIKYYILFVALNFLDLIGSYFLLGPDQELNPICAYIWKTYGFATLVVFKVLNTIIPIAILNYCHRIQPKMAKYTIMFANVLVLIPVILLGYLWSLL